MLELSRKVNLIDRWTREGRLTRFGMSETVGTEMSGKRLGLVGSGNVAKHVARIAKNGFGMSVYCYNPHRTAEEIAKLGMEPVKTLDELFSACDYVSLHCRLTEETYHMIDTALLEKASSKPILINTARGGLIDEAALYEALREGRLTAAGLDVFERQPPSIDDPLFTLPNFLAGMHVAGSTVEAMERTGRAVVDSVFDALGILE